MAIADLSSIPHNEIETGVVVLGAAYAASLIGLIVWLA